MTRCLPLAGALVCAVVSTGTCQAKVGAHWKVLPPLLTPRQEVGVAADATHVYVIGGIVADRSATGVVERLDVAAETWEPVPPLPADVRIHHAGAASSQGLIFVIGGLNAAFRGVRTVFAYDPAARAWTRRADLARARGAMAIAAIGDRIYAAGGQDGSTSFDDFAAYHVNDDRWDPLPPLPTPRNHLAGVGFEGIFYDVGGRAGGLFDVLEAFNPTTSRWRELEPMPTARGGIAAAVAGECIFVFGGEGNADDPDGVFAQVEGYDICSGRWASDDPMPSPRHGIGAAAVGSYIYIPGGSPVEGFGVTGVADAYFAGSPGRSEFLRGDANFDAEVDVSDAVRTLVVLFTGGVQLACRDAADADDSGEINVTDPIFVLSFLFLGGTPPPAPGPSQPGVDPTDDLLDCTGELPRECVPREDG